MNITTVGIDLAKNVFSVHGVDAHDKVIRLSLNGCNGNLCSRIERNVPKAA